jgi:hypothetical protein
LLTVLTQNIGSTVTIVQSAGPVSTAWPSSFVGFKNVSGGRAPPRFIRFWAGIIRFMIHFLEMHFFAEDRSPTETIIIDHHHHPRTTDEARSK